MVTETLGIRDGQWSGGDESVHAGGSSDTGACGEDAHPVTPRGRIQGGVHGSVAGSSESRPGLGPRPSDAEDARRGGRNLQRNGVRQHAQIF